MHLANFTTVIEKKNKSMSTFLNDIYSSKKTKFDDRKTLSTHL